jgi:hypothetical protein
LEFGFRQGTNEVELNKGFVGAVERQSCSIVGGIHGKCQLNFTRKQSRGSGEIKTSEQTVSNEPLSLSTKIIQAVSPSS